jgi:hypothetical protein
MAEVAPQVYHSSCFYRRIWPNFFPPNYDTILLLKRADHIDYQYETTTSPMSETVVNIVLLVISQLLIPGAVRFIVRLWPSLREYSIRVMLMLA